MDITIILINLATLTALEIILGVDNLVFISIVTSRLPIHQQARARRIGLALALFGRYALLCTAGWIVQLNAPLFNIFSKDFSWHNLFMLCGGAFLLIKGTLEIHHEIDPPHDSATQQNSYKKFSLCILQILLFDLVFSLDSILTAIGLTTELWIMAIAITIAVIAMILTSEPVSRFVNNHPSIKILALSFLLLIGMVLVAEGFSYSIPKGYIYFSISFSLLVESLNIARIKKRQRGIA
jgi:predicted tellurium resistance membrane protein TerC